MPWLTRAGARLFWRSDGDSNGDLGRPALLLLHSLGTSHRLWDGVVDALAPQFHLLRPDARGHGASAAPPGDTTVAELAADALAVLDEAGVAQAAVAGVSMGGMVAMQMALTAPRRLTALALCNSTAELAHEPWRRAGWRSSASSACRRWRR